MAIKNITDLNNQANTLLPDNNQQSISPADVRTAIKDLNDSAINRLTDRLSLNLRTYDPTRSYDIGEGVFYNSVIYEAVNATTGAFNSSDWEARSSPSGTWGGIMGDIGDQTDLASLLAAKQNSITANSPIYLSGSTLNIQQATNTQNGYLSQSDWAAFHAKENVLTITSPLIRTGDTLSVQYVSDTQDGVVAFADWNAINNSFIEISYDDALALVIGGGLNKGKFYKILAGTRTNENSGTSGSVIVQALDIDTFASEGYLITRLPKYEDIGSAIVAIWTAPATPATDDLYIYNGKVYKNLTGTNDTSPDTDTTNWVLIDSSISNYKTETNYIHYDFVYDWIFYREDARGNRYCFSRSNGSSENGIDKFQWGNDAVYSNTIDNGILDNLNNTEASVGVTLIKKGIYNSISPTANRTYTFPDEDGTVALLSDIGGGFIPNENANYVFVNASGTATDNGHALISALAAAKLLTPNGVALSTTNRAVIYLLVGNYDLGTNFLALDEFVDIVGIGAAKEIIVTSSNSTATVQIDNTNDYVLKNFTLISTGGSTISHNASQTDHGLWEDMIITSGSYTNTENTIFNGTYRRCQFTGWYALNGSISGLVDSCTFTNVSCGVSTTADVTISGTITNCKCAGVQSFGWSNTGSVTISGTISNCSSLYLSFGGAYGSSSAGNVIISGIIKNCTAANQSFGMASGSVTISGSISDCTADYESYGYVANHNITISGIISNCIGGNSSFGYTPNGSLTISGTIKHCTGNYSSFGRGSTAVISGFINDCFATTDSFGKATTTVTISGIVQDCTASNNSFGSSEAGSSSVTISGTMLNCNAANSFGCFGSTTSAGKLINCSRDGDYGTHLGIIDRCLFKSSGTALTLGEGAIVKYSTFTGGSCFYAASPVTAAIYFCAASSSVEDSGNITNSISTPYNVIDSSITL